MDSKSRYQSVAAIKQVTDLIHDMTDDTVYMRATDLIHNLFSTHITMVVTLDYLYRCNKIKALSSEQPANHYLLDDLQLIVSQHINDNSRKDYIVPNKLSALFSYSDYFTIHHIQGYVGSAIITEKGEMLGLLISLTTGPIVEPDEILNWHHFATQLIIKHAFCLKCQSKTDGLFEKLNYEVSHDNLTGLFNRSYLSDTLERLITTSEHNNTFSLVLIDLDNFKAINDIYGNYIGDQVLRYVSSCIQNVINDDKFVFRVAADEFAFILFDKNPTEICTNILKVISKGYRQGNVYIKLSASCGVVTRNDHETDAEQILLNASLALKDCKNTQGKLISCFNTELYEQYYRQTQIVEALKNELHRVTAKRSEFYVVLQPIIHRKHTEWQRFEVLTRWQSTELGSISPVEFIAAAEQSGLMVDLGHLILQKTCEAKAQIEQSIGKNIHLSLNCSAQELNHSQNYADLLTKTITDWKFSPCDFTLEITETALLEQDKSVNDVLYYLRNFGFRIALDDFGTGYSSLNYVHSYPVDCLKIDASFIKNMLENSTSEKIVKLIVQLAELLGLDLIAEGVENRTALEKLYSMGCHWIQGYYFSKPITPNEIINRLQYAENETEAGK
ncbi:putative bifunctional diguanylate cyclase/phosphodiesterase [Vibrio salinus]|uniref:putative bifunctional diguanylate cyclase/phosphodiesterase n=1 Tax=Vibrio salinus TaxID=2899784 RepID=UPI001E57BC09|nr:bifunctional diguanylate cyclase/phosphodiesterase [Vibrio salinus]MCE0494947.1 bifunctional diguanylate cyclase/phosphodiesterase [Vibrio salinus]